MNLQVPSIRRGNTGRRLTGRGVFFWLLGFFGFVTIVNIAIIQAALSTFGGLDTPSSYRAGLEFKENAAAAEAQRALGWQVDGTLDHTSDGQRLLTVTILDKNGMPISDVDVAAQLMHLVDSRRDVAIAMQRAGAGRYEGVATAPTGQWRLDLVISRDNQTLFRSRNRLVVRLRHLLTPAAPARANVEVIRTARTHLIPVELENLTFEREPGRKWASNVKFAPLGVR
jgi:nitrogen fixation protein FixH